MSEVSIKDQFIERFGFEMFGGMTGPSRIQSSLRFELGVGRDSLTYMITALRRFNTIIDDLGFKDRTIGVAAYAYMAAPNELCRVEPPHQQLMPFARAIDTLGGMRFCRSEFLSSKYFDQRTPDFDDELAVHFGTCSFDDGRFLAWLMRHLIRDYAGHDTPLLMLFDLELGVMVNPYDDRGMDVFGPNRELLSELYKKRNGWLLDYDRERMQAVYG